MYQWGIKNGQSIHLSVTRKMSLISNLVAFLPLLVLGQDYASNPVFSFEQFEQSEHTQIPVKSYARNFPNPTYSREMPNSWMGNPIFEIPTLDHFKPGNSQQSSDKLGLGPRRRKRHDVNARKDVQGVIHHLVHMPLWCWKIYINCAVFPKHVCCPIMHKDNIQKEATYIRNANDERSKVKNNLNGGFLKHLLHMPLFCWKINVKCADKPNGFLSLCCPVNKKKLKLRKRRSLPRSGREIDPLFGIPIETSPKRRKDILGKTKPPSGGNQDEITAAGTLPKNKQTDLYSLFFTE